LLNGIRRKRLRRFSHAAPRLRGAVGPENVLKRGRLAAVTHGGAANMQFLQSVTCFLPCAGVYTSGADEQLAPPF
jgi:hypothetical protein